MRFSLPRTIGGADVDDVDVEQLLDRVLDLDLVGVARDLEEQLRLERLGIDVPSARPPVSLSSVPFSVRSGRLMIVFGRTHGFVLTPWPSVGHGHARLERLDGVLGDHEAVVVEDVVDVEPLGRRGTGDVGRLRADLTRLAFVLARRPPAPTRRPSALRTPASRLVLGAVEWKLVDDDELLLLGAQRQRRGERRPLAPSCGSV